jgi:hypothetical protein
MLQRVIVLAMVGGSALLQAQVSIDQLAKPPGGAQTFSIVSTAGTHGKAAIWVESDGRRMSRESLLLRGQVWESDESVKLGDDGMPSKLDIRGFSPQGDAAERFAIADGTAGWKSPLDSGSHAYSTAFYVAQGGPTSIGAQLLIETLLKSPDKSLSLLPPGRAHAERLTELTVGSGATSKTVTDWAVTGLSPSPSPIWTTADGKFFAVVNGALSWLPTGYEGDLKKLYQAQNEARAARSPALMKALLKTPAGPVAFTHVRAFLDGNHFAEDQTIVVDKGVIATVGPAGSVSVPKDAQLGRVCNPQGSDPRGLSKKLCQVVGSGHADAQERYPDRCRHRWLGIGTSPRTRALCRCWFHTRRSACYRDDRSCASGGRRQDDRVDRRWQDG